MKSAANAVDLLIHSRPLWQAVDPQQIPVSVTISYGVMGRRNNKWESILSSTDDIYTARRTMEAANTAGIFDRIVITKARRVNNTPAANWETIECAIPQHRVVTGDSFGVLLQNLQTKAANVNPEEVHQHNPAPIIGEKQPQTVSLLIACVLAGLGLNAPALIFIAALAVAEICFLTNKTPIRKERLAVIHTFRTWFYAVFNGALLAPLVVHFFG